jgi:hypothetical protein
MISQRLLPEQGCSGASADKAAIHDALFDIIRAKKTASLIRIHRNRPDSGSGYFAVSMPPFTP